MTVYIEYVFLNNLAINYLISYLTLVALKEKQSLFRMLLASGIGAALSVVYPALTNISFAIKLILSIVMVLILKKEFKNLKEFVAAVFILYLISFTLAGATLMLKDILDLGESLMPFSVLGGVFVGSIVIRFVIKMLYERRKTASFLYDVLVKTKSGDKMCIGYYDSGNKLYYNDNSPIIVISEQLQKKLNLENSGDIAVKTVAGVKILKLVKIDFQIYYQNGLNKIYCTMAAVSDSLTNGNYDMILHRDMC